MITNETKTSDMLTVFNNKESAILFNKLMNTILDTQQMHKDIIY